MVSEVNNIEKSKTRLIDFPKKKKKKSTGNLTKTTISALLKTDAF
jgi:hypothetical protein